jgi:hypothetical protein
MSKRAVFWRTQRFAEVMRSLRTPKSRQNHPFHQKEMTDWRLASDLEFVPAKLTKDLEFWPAKLRKDLESVPALSKSPPTMCPLEPLASPWR